MSKGDQVYTPAEDSFLLLRAALREVRPGDRVLEVGTGSGYIAAGLVGRAARVVATDINPHAAASARARGVEVVRTDMAAGISGPFDLILFNPPYLPTAPEERIDDWLEYALDGGPTGRAVIERFIADAGRVLAPSGRILLLISSLTGPDEVREVFTRHGFVSFIVDEEPLEGETLYVLRAMRDICRMRL
ncbi:HemK2/MTQ2 family protein methyltransferase [Methanoculleus receptaculi]|uniref:HemK2/MTQ2 family protein methyltransferase n=1 Tax=Methanoculleus receptaculi TaxID=394967 RepID=A0AAX4FV65_9EURY|nr:HemK2/MTQ2 family protein methyltransferase [Methanoculleus receptaculi]MDI3506516.1 release factor glutamine methyltransferase [Methanomicrobiaceae archaeon]MDK2862451.1 release factor glutamine methyltransferase [Methanomicrobiaceae archaeon]WOX57700.1 HemK2/MTQ2 family protein methyltransferase [Methanoculleus receptaculi]